MANYAWEFGSEGSGLWFTITYNSDTNELTVSSLEGKFDFNALWFGDGDSTAGEHGGTALSKADNSLNMNGSGVAWDGYLKFSNPGLGAAGENKDTFISEGETATFTLNATQIANFEAALSSPDFQIGVRATSVTGGDYNGGSIKYVGSEIPEPTIDVVKSADTETIAAGEVGTDVEFTYTLQNTSEHETFKDMYLVSLIDDNGTPLDTSDDKLLAEWDYDNEILVLGKGVELSGDDGDGILQAGETWIFTWTSKIQLDEIDDVYTNTVTATGESKNLVVMDTAEYTITAVEGPGGEEEEDDHFPVLSISHVTFYFYTGFDEETGDPNFAGDTVGLVTKTKTGFDNDPDGWFTVKFDEGAVPVPDDLDDWYQDALDFIYATFPDLDPSTFVGVAIKDGSGEHWHTLDGDKDNEGDPPLIFPITDKEIDEDYIVTSMNPFDAIAA
jgi:hypothetical protein